MTTLQNKATSPIAHLSADDIENLGRELDAIRQLVLPGTPQFIPLRWEILAVIVQIAGYAILSQISLRYLEHRAREDARLILRST